MKGKFITFEGCEGSGKSTQLSLFENYLKENNIDYIYTREPGGTKISEKIRNLILDVDNSEMTDECEALLYASSRIQHIKEKILPALKEGKLVICDRYIDSSLSYQGYARNLGIDFIKQINSFCFDNCMPNYTIFLNISSEDAFKRKGGADKDDRLELSGANFHKRVYDGYLKCANEYKDRFLMIDCSGTKYQTHQKIVDILKEKGVL